MQKYIPKSLTGYHLKVIAIVSMLIDHLAYIPIASVLSTAYSVQDGSIVYTGFREKLYLWILENESVLWTLNDVMHWIGRLAFPLFCFLLVQGFMHTRNKGKYASRLALFAIISEVPYDMAFNGCLLSFKNNNVFFTLLIGLLMMWALSEIKKLTDKAEALKTPAIKNIVYTAATIVVIAVALLLVSTIFDASYGISGVFTILIIFLLYRRPVLALIISTFILAVMNISFMELFALPSALLVAMYNQKRGKPIKYFFYLFYPAHLFIFTLVAMWLGNMTIVMGIG